MAKFDIGVWDHDGGSISYSRGGQKTTIQLGAEERARFQLLAEEIWQSRQEEISAATIPPALADFSNVAPVPDSDSKVDF